MTYQLWVKCLICKKLTDPTNISNKETNAEALNLLHNKLCAALKLEFSPEYREWDFAEEPFPYCESCGQRLQRLGELVDQRKSIQEEISGSLATVSALVITSEKSDTGTSDPLVTPQLGQMKEYFTGRRLQEKQSDFRSLIIQRFNPRVTIELIDPAWNHPALSHEQHNYELLPKPLLLKIEPAIEEFSDNAAAEEATESEAEYKVELGSDVISVAEAIGQFPTKSSSLTKVPILASASIASGKVESPNAILFNTSVLMKQVRSKKCTLRFDESSKTGEYNDLTFKELEYGSYMCPVRLREDRRCVQTSVGEGVPPSSGDVVDVNLEDGNSPCDTAAAQFLEVHHSSTESKSTVESIKGCPSIHVIKKKTVGLSYKPKRRGFEIGNGTETVPRLPVLDPDKDKELKKKAKRREYDKLRPAREKKLEEKPVKNEDQEIQTWLQILRAQDKELTPNPDVRLDPPKPIYNLDEIERYTTVALEEWIKTQGWHLIISTPKTWRKRPEIAFKYKGNYYFICPFCNEHPELGIPENQKQSQKWSQHRLKHQQLPCYANSCNQRFNHPSRRRRHMKDTHCKPASGRWIPVIPQ